ncbi:MAG: ATP-binding protein, partial [Kiritimatiellia bacterium]
LVSSAIPDESLVHAPLPIADDDWQALLRFGGFPEPFTSRDVRFQKKWQRLRAEQLLREDIRDLTRTTDLDLIERLARLLANRSGEMLVYASLAREINVSEPTVKTWVSVLKSLYYGFEIRPWFKNIENSLRKTSKWYLRDWSAIEDEGRRNETFIACHLLKAVELWTDIGLGDYALYYIRDKQKHEVDFLVTKDGKPWFLVEAKSSETSISPVLGKVQAAIRARHAFQIVVNMPFVNANAFDFTRPVIVSARTFLSQLP